MINHRQKLIYRATLRTCLVKLCLSSTLKGKWKWSIKFRGEIKWSWRGVFLKNFEVKQRCEMNLEKKSVEKKFQSEAEVNMEKIGVEKMSK